MLAYDYRAGSARLDDLPEIPISPHLYVLCERCATSLRAPRGWVLDDRRTSSAPATSSAAPPGPATADRRVETAERRGRATEPDDGQRQLAFGYSA